MARILVVDDEVYIRKIIDFNLRKHGHTVVLAEDAFQAQEFFDKGEKFDLIISDMMMPIMSGLDLVRSIRNKYKLTNQRIMFLSAKGIDEDVKEAKKYAVDDYMLKPFSVERLLKKIDRILNTPENDRVEILNE